MSPSKLLKTWPHAEATIVDVQSTTINDNLLVHAYESEFERLATDGRNPHVVLCFREVRGFGTSFINALLQFRNALQQRAGSLSLCGMRDEVRGELIMMRLDGKSLEIYDTPADAIDVRREQRQPIPTNQVPGRAPGVNEFVALAAPARSGRAAFVDIEVALRLECDGQPWRDAALLIEFDGSCGRRRTLRTNPDGYATGRFDDESKNVINWPARCRVPVAAGDEVAAHTTVEMVPRLST